MRRTELTGDDAKPNSLFNFIFENAMGNIIILDAAPTAAVPILKENQVGYYSNKVYFVTSGVLKEFTVSSTA